MLQESIVVDLKDLFIYVMKKCWIALLVSVVGAALLGGMEKVKGPDDRGDEATLTAHPTPTPLTIDNAKKKLTETEIIEVERVWDSVLQLEEKQEEMNREILANPDQTQEEDDAMTRLLSTQTQLYTYRNSMINALSADQKLYLEALRKGIQNENDIETVPTPTPSTEGKEYEEAHVSTMADIVKKAILGAILGIMMTDTILVMVYLYDGKIKSEKELKYTYGIDILDTINNKKDSEMETILPENLGMMMIQRDYSLIYVIVEQESDRKLIDKIEKKMIKKYDGLFIRSGNPIVESKALQEMVEADSVVLMVRLKNTRRDDVIKCKDLCSRFDKDLIGGIVVM